MGQQRIAVDFCDWGITYGKTDWPLYHLLRRRFPLEVTDGPDFVFYTHNGDHHKLHTGVRIFHTAEADQPPDWRVCDYALTPHYIDHPRHLRFPPYTLLFEPEWLVQAPGEAALIAPQKTKFCAFLSTYRNEKTRLRWNFFDKLSARKRVDSAGRAGNNVGFDVPFGVENTINFLRPYKFCMAFENKSAPGYVSEKLLLGLAARCIPIYYGCPRAGEEFNPRRFLNYHDFPSEDALIARIMEIDDDDALYQQYLAEPPFHDNRPNPIFDPEYFWKFFDKVFHTPIVPTAARNAKSWRRLLGRWTLARRDRPHAPF
jgi:hypothetical protein